MALNVHLQLKLDNSDVKGVQGQDNTITHQGGDDVTELIQVVRFEQAVNVGSATTGNQIATAGRSYAPATFYILMGQSFVYLSKALRLNQRFDGVFQFYANNHDTGVTERAYTLTMNQGRIIGLRVINDFTMDPNTANLPLLVEVRAVAHTYIHDSFGTQDQDQFSAQSA